MVPVRPLVQAEGKGSNRYGGVAYDVIDTETCNRGTGLAHHTLPVCLCVYTAHPLLCLLSAVCAPCALQAGTVAHTV